MEAIPNLPREIRENHTNLRQVHVSEETEKTIF
jgi:hypothetical protein